MLFFFPNPWLVADAEKEERDNEDDHKAKRQEIIPKEDPSTREENEESINLHGKKVLLLVD